MRNTQLLVKGGLKWVFELTTLVLCKSAYIVKIHQVLGVLAVFWGGLAVADLNYNLGGLS